MDEGTEIKKENDIEQKKKEIKNKIKTFLKDKHNLILIAILIFSFALLLHYFSLTNGQTIWHDEAEYMSAAKYWAFNIPFDIHPARPPLLSFFAFLLFKVGFQGSGIRFILELLPMLLIVFFTYLLVKEMYNKKIALITAFITSVSWIHLFYAMRIMTDMLGLLFGILAILCFWKGYIKKQSKYYIWIMGFFIALSFLCRLTGIMYGGVIFLFLLITQRLKFFKNKHLWIAVLVFLLTISPYLIWNYSYHGNLLAFRQGYGGVPDAPPGWSMVQFVYDYPELVFFILFIIGLLTLLPMFLTIDLTLFKKNKKHYNDLFLLILILSILLFFIFFIRGGENRWLIAMSIGIFTFASKGLISIYNLIKKYSKFFAIILFIGLIILGAYFQLNHADIIIKNKVNSYLPVKEAALWIKENSNPNDIILTASVPQTVYYSERKVISFFNSSENAYYSPEQLTSFIDLEKPRYLIVSIFEPSNPQWTLTYPSQNSEKFQAVKIWFEDIEQQNPLLIIYEVNYNV